MSWEAFDRELDLEIDFTRRLIHRNIDELGFRYFRDIYIALDEFAHKYRCDVRPAEEIRRRLIYFNDVKTFLEKYPGVIAVTGDQYGGAPLFLFSMRINNVFYKAEVVRDLIIILKNGMPISCYAEINEVEDNCFELTMR